jgi:tRNA-dihydrouridine synthase
MAYYNPMIPQMPFAFSPVAQPQQAPINPQQFAAVAATLNPQSLNQLAQMARQRGISEADINAGLQFIQSLR